jgi:signal transduction histidine kinase
MTMTIAPHQNHTQLMTMAQLLAQDAYTLPIDGLNLPETYDQELRTIQDAALRFNDRLTLAQRDWAGWDETHLQKLRHDLKNDLNLIVGFTHLQLRDKTSPLNGDQRTVLEYLYARGRTLASLVNSLR